MLMTIGKNRQIHFLYYHKTTNFYWESFESSFHLCKIHNSIFQWIREGDLMFRIICTFLYFSKTSDRWQKPFSEITNSSLKKRENVKFCSFEVKLWLVWGVVWEYYIFDWGELLGSLVNLLGKAPIISQLIEWHIEGKLQWESEVLILHYGIWGWFY